jgi:hypothetical protein
LKRIFEGCLSPQKSSKSSNPQRDGVQKKERQKVLKKEREKERKRKRKKKKSSKSLFK